MLRIIFIFIQTDSEYTLTVSKCDLQLGRLQACEPVSTPLDGSAISVRDQCYDKVQNLDNPKVAKNQKIAYASFSAIIKRVGLLVTGADAYEDNAEGIFIAFDRIADFLLARKSGEFYVGDCTVPADMAEKVKNKALELSRSLVG